MPIGFDTPIDASRYVSEIKTANFDFIIRYYRSSHSQWPTLTFSEAHILSSAGLRIVSIWEYQSDKIGSFTHIRGVDESTSAYAQAHALGQTSGSTIYFAVDLDPSETQVSGPVVDYFQGVAAGFAAAGKGSPAYKVGVYGSGRVCRMLVEAGLAKYTWMANATDWGESDIFKKWNINQRKHNPNLTFDNDADEAIQDYGDFALPSALSPGTAIA